MNNYLLFELQPEEKFKELLLAELADIGFEGFLETDNGIEAYLPEQDFNPESFEEIWLKYNSDKAIPKGKTIEPQNWNAEWESNFEPVTIANKLIIRAPFHSVNANFDDELIIQPKTSFGTGHHETTRTILELMLEEDFNGKSVFDFGSGTGILAIFANKKGASYIFANDIDEWAAENIYENCLLNNCEGVIFEKVPLAKCPITQFDFILANINKNVLMESFEELSVRAKSLGKLYISGFFESDLPELKAQAESASWKFVSKKVENNWCAALFQKL